MNNLYKTIFLEAQQIFETNQISYDSSINKFIASFFKKITYLHGLLI